MPQYTHYHSNEPSHSQVSLQTDEYKANYDDLIDEEHASPFAPTNHHQTFSVQAPMNNMPHHTRDPSFPLTKSFSSKQSEIDWEQDSTAHAASSYPPVPMKEKEVDTRKWWQKWLPDSLACRLYVLTVLIETIIDLAIEGELLLLVKPEDSGGDRDVRQWKMPVYLSIFAMAHIFQFVMAVDAVYARNTLQFLLLTLFNALFLVYAGVQISEIQQAVEGSEKVFSKIPIQVLTKLIPVVISIAEVAYIALGWKIYNEFGWQVYKFLGADRRIRQLYTNYQIYECLIKFDVFFWVGFSVQFIWLVLNEQDWEYYVTCAALPLSLILLVEGHLAARYENKWMMATFISGLVGAMVYFVYKLIKLLILKDTDQFKLVWKTMTVFSIIAIVLLIATFAYSVLIMRNFGRGLKGALERRNAPGHTRYASQPHRRGGSKTLNRMSIN